MLPYHRSKVSCNATVAPQAHTEVAVQTLWLSVAVQLSLRCHCVCTPLIQRVYGAYTGCLFSQRFYGDVYAYIALIGASIASMNVCMTKTNKIIPMNKICILNTPSVSCVCRESTEHAVEAIWAPRQSQTKYSNVIENKESSVAKPLSFWGRPNISILISDFSCDLVALWKVEQHRTNAVKTRKKTLRTSEVRNKNLEVKNCRQQYTSLRSAYEKVQKHYGQRLTIVGNMQTSGILKTNDWYLYKNGEKTHSHRKSQPLHTAKKHRWQIVLFINFS